MWHSTIMAYTKVVVLQRGVKAPNFALRNQEDMVSSVVRHIPTNELNLSKMNAKIFSIMILINLKEFDKSRISFKLFKVILI